ncbi:MAG TPA: hypothetical protein VL859_08705 [Flavobacterium sp.]|nr:hypothetical protein [Flavobacterium sp.]
MFTITLDFYNKLANEDIFEDQIFDFDGQTLSVNQFKSEWITFKNCTFNCKNLEFKNIQNEKLTLEFYNCIFNCNVSFLYSTLDNLRFKNTKALKSLNIGSGISKLKLNVFEFSNDSEIEKPELSTDFNIRNTNFEIFIFEYINHTNGMFRFLGNTILKQDSNGNISSFGGSTITNILFYNNTFGKYANFKRVIFNSTENLKPPGSGFEFPGFYKNNFAKVSFSQSKFTCTFQFENCDFLSTTSFENCKNLDNSKLKFVACEFKGFSLFNKSKINFLDIDRCTFDKSSSFTDTEFNTLKLFEVKFGGGAYFDEMKINKVLDKSYLKNNSEILEWKRTLRAIKQELQKTENKIDFNRFRSYELAAHYQELDWKWNSGFIDKSILFAAKISTDFGNSWRKALRFTIVSGFLIYLFLYIIENRKFSIDTLNWNNWERLLSGFFRFLLVTDFYNPLETDRIYLTNPLSWLILIFGKIVIAFGIYEMIQSFRKFKA